MITNSGAIVRVRPYLLASAAGIGLLVGGVAQAAIADGPVDAARRLDPTEAGLEAQGGVDTLRITSVENVRHSTDVIFDRTQLQDVPTNGAPIPANATVEDVRQIVISQPGTPTTARDTGPSVNGIGQMIISTPNPDGSVGLGLCTGSLINPRTVLFAAHCVNTRPATAYGSGSGGVAIGFGFNASNNTALPGGTSTPLLNWLFGSVAAGRAPNLTSTAENFYTVNAVAYNPLSLAPAAQGFLFGDIAIASLDTPAANIPTWAILLSALPAPTSITAANGTGYHVALSGYGRNGIGNVGDTGAIDFRRRVAENWLGALTSFNTRDTAIFGSFTVDRPQNLYWLDFDDPRRGTASATVFDFNLFRDNALPNEGLTAGGDSGGPLILDRTFARQIAIGVLSGGSRFFAASPFSTYGTASFYQPIYLYWDWIAANNPYRYVGAVAGDGNWTDPSRWISLQDPNYFIIGPNGQLVNGVPTALGEQNLGSSGQFGQICTQGGIAGAIGSNNCLDLRTNTIVPTPGGIGTSGGAELTNGGESSITAGTSNSFGTATITANDAATPGAVTLVGGEAENAPQQGAPLPPATIANGLPGARNFVPNNSAGNRLTGVLPRYFDVTLSANGTTTLDTAVTIDRFTLNGAGARLNITSTGSLTSLINVTQTIGTLQVDGALNSVGDFLLMTGGINGTGTITAPFFTSVLGVISPGATGSAGSIGTLTFRGNIVLTSGNSYLVDLGANGVSDRISVVANGASSGRANVGGGLNLSWAPATLRAGNTYTILQAQNGVSGAFSAPVPISAILTPRLVQTATSVQLVIGAGLYRNVAGGSSVQQGFAQLLDQNRVNAAALDSIYGVLDLQNAATIRATLDALAPRNEALLNGIATTVVDSNARFHRDRLAQFDASQSRGGTIAVIGQPLQLAAANASTLQGGLPVQSDSAPARVTKANLPDDIGIYLAGGYVDGSSASAPGLTPAGRRDRFNGFYIIGGIEKDLGDGMIGLSFGYTELNGTVNGFAQTTRGSLYQGTLYARSELGGGWSMDGQVNAGLFDSSSVRNVNFVGNNFRLVANNTAFAVSGEVGVQNKLTFGALNVAPRVSVRSNVVDFGRAAESGGGPALVYERADLSSVQGRAGLNFTASKQSTFKPYISANYVHEFDKQRPNVVGANFVGGSGPDARFLLASVDRNWFEISGGVTYAVGNMELSLSADSTVARSDVQNQSYRGSIKLRF